jgi:hypothetical protein
MVLLTRAAVDELPAHVGRCGEPVDVDHVVFPLDATSRLMVVTAGVAAMLLVLDDLVVSQPRCK